MPSVYAARFVGEVSVENSVETVGAVLAEVQVEAAGVVDVVTVENSRLVSVFELYDYVLFFLSIQTAWGFLHLPS